MKKKSMEQIERHGLFDEAKERYENCQSPYWKNEWWGLLCEMYAQNKTWQEKYIINYDSRSIEPAVTKAKRRKTLQVDETSIKWGDIEISYLNKSHQHDTNNGEKTYLFKFYTGASIIFSKIGTTAKNCLKRLKDEIRYYVNHGFEIVKVEICGIFSCGEAPAESYESFMRALLIKKYPNTWKKNDRFFGIDIPTSLFFSLCEEYANM